MTPRPGVNHAIPILWGLKDGGDVWPRGSQSALGGMGAVPVMERVRDAAAMGRRPWARPPPPAPDAVVAPELVGPKAPEGVQSCLDGVMCESVGGGGHQNFHQVLAVHTYACERVYTQRELHKQGTRRT